MPVVNELADRLRLLPRRRQTLLVGIDGCGGAGKSTLARALADAIPATSVVQFDDFYDPVGLPEVGGHFDWRRLREQVLAPLSADEPGRYQRYDWDADRLAEWHAIRPGGVVIVEGNYSTRAELHGYYGFTIWVDAPRELRLERGLARGGRDTRERWLEEWMPEEERYIAAQDPRGRVDAVVESPSG